MRSIVTLALAMVICALALLAHGAEAGVPTTYTNYFHRNGSLAIVDGDNGIVLMHTDGSHRESFRDGKAPVWSPDGEMLAYEDGMDIRVVNADGSNDHLVTLGTDPSWTPDGQLVFSYVGDIMKVPLAGSPIVNLTNTDTVDETQPAASPDGRYIAYTSDEDTMPDELVATIVGPFENLWIMQANGDDPHLLYESNPGEYGGNPAWAPDSHRIAFATGNDIWTVPPNGNNPTNLTNDDPVQSFPAWSSDGTLIAYAQSPAIVVFGGAPLSEIWTIDTDSSTRTNLTNDAGAHDTMPDWQPWFVQNGQLAFINDDQAELVFADADGKHYRSTRHQANFVSDVDFSPDATFISTIEDNFADFYDSFGQDTNFLIATPDHSSAVAWFPDSKHIVVATDAGEMYDVSPGDLGANLTNTDDVYEFAPAVSPDGKRIAFLTNQIEGSDPPTAGATLAVWTMDFSGLDRQYVTPVPLSIITAGLFEGNQIAWSPDGNTLAYVSDHDIWTVGPHGSNPTNLTNDSLIQSHVVWSPDGKLIAFDQTANSSSTSSIWTIDPDTRHRTRFEPVEDSLLFPAWQPIWGTHSDNYYVIGDNDCSGKAGAASVLTTLKWLADIPGTHQPGCPWLGEHALTSLGEESTWGDTDCSGVVDAEDVLYGLEYILDTVSDISQPLPMGFNECPPIGAYLEWIPLN